MNKPLAISGTFVALTPVASRKVVRLHIECAIELADNILACLGGYPDPANPKHVAVAQLNTEAREEPPPRTKREFKSLPAPQQAALACQSQIFRAFLREVQEYDCATEDEAADYVRTFCEVESRADIKPGTIPAQKWAFLCSAYLGWQAAEHAGA